MAYPKVQKKTVRKTYPEWNEDVERLVFYADFMGFKARVLSKTHADIKKELKAFHEKWYSKMKPLAKGGHLKFVQFSDSILIVANGVDSKMFNLLSKAAVCLVHTAMSMQIPIKGVIAQGIFTYNQEEEIFFGKPLVDAYMLHENLKYYGVVVHHSAEKTVKKYQDASNPYSKKPINIDKGMVRHYHLCWNLLNEGLHSMDITDRAKLWLEQISENVSGEPRMYVDRTWAILKADRKLITSEREIDEED